MYSFRGVGSQGNGKENIKEYKYKHGVLPLGIIVEEFMPYTLCRDCTAILVTQGEIVSTKGARL